MSSALPLLIIFAAVYGFFAGMAVSRLLGMGPDNIEDMTFGLLPGVGAVVLSLALYWKHFVTRRHHPAGPHRPGLTTGPTLSYIS